MTFRSFKICNFYLSLTIIGLFSTSCTSKNEEDVYKNSNAPKAEKYGDGNGPSIQTSGIPCGAGRYSDDNGACIRVGISFYSPEDSNERLPCNRPSNALNVQFSPIDNNSNPNCEIQDFTCQENFIKDSGHKDCIFNGPSRLGFVNGELHFKGQKAYIWGHACKVNEMVSQKVNIYRVDSQGISHIIKRDESANLIMDFPDALTRCGSHPYDLQSFKNFLFSYELTDDTRSKYSGQKLKVTFAKTGEKITISHNRTLSIPSLPAVQCQNDEILIGTQCVKKDYKGFIEPLIANSYYWGHACIKGQENPIRVRIFSRGISASDNKGDRLIADILTNEPAEKAITGPNYCHVADNRLFRFSYFLTNHVKADHQGRKLIATFEYSHKLINNALANTTILMPPVLDSITTLTSANVRGYIDSVHNGYASGWACILIDYINQNGQSVDSNFPYKDKIQINLYANGKMVGGGVTSILRNDVSLHSKNPCGTKDRNYDNHGFKIKLKNTYQLNQLTFKVVAPINYANLEGVISPSSW